MEEVKQKPTKLHLILNADVYSDNKLVNILDEEIKEFSNREDAWKYVDSLDGKYEQYLMLNRQLYLIFLHFRYQPLLNQFKKRKNKITQNLHHQYLN